MNFSPISLLRATASINFVPGLSFLISGLHTMEEEKTLGTRQDPHFKGAETGKVNEGVNKNQTVFSYHRSSANSMA